MQLTYTRVVATISGRVGLRQVDPGNIVRAADSNGIVVITQLSPMGVVFPIPEDALPRVMKRLKAGDRIPVDAYDRAQKEKLGSGRLLTADNQIDTATGTIKLKADRQRRWRSFENRSSSGVPSKHCQRDDCATEHQRGAAGTFASRQGPIRSDGEPVQIGSTQVRSVDRNWAGPGAWVVVDGADRLREGPRSRWST